MLQTAEVVESSGFAIGFGSTFLHRDTLEHPLWAIFGSSMSGFFCAFGANIVGGCVPVQARFVFPLAATSFLSYRFYQLFQLRVTSPPAYQ